MDAIIGTGEATPSLLPEPLDGDIRIIVLMGVSGTGKSTLGRALAEKTGLPFVDGDDLHPAANVAKMARGEPLEDADRWPWLETVRATAEEVIADQVRVGNKPGVIVACSALKRAYRAVLRGRGERTGSTTTWFVHLGGDRAVLMARMLGRKGHFMKAGMLESQLDALESPEGEPGVVTVSVEMPTDAQVEAVLRTIGLAAATV